MFRAIISLILRSTRLCLQLVVWCTDDAVCTQHRRCITPQAVNTVYCSWGWAKLSPETCSADWNYQWIVIVASIWLFILLLEMCLTSCFSKKTSYKHKLGMCFTYCFSTTTMVLRTPQYYVMCILPVFLTCRSHLLLCINSTKQRKGLKVLMQNCRWKCETKNVNSTLFTHHFLFVSSYAYLILFLPGFNYERTKILLMSFVPLNPPLQEKFYSYIWSHFFVPVYH